MGRRNSRVIKFTVVSLLKNNSIAVHSECMHGNTIISTYITYWLQKKKKEKSSMSGIID